MNFKKIFVNLIFILFEQQQQYVYVTYFFFFLFFVQRHALTHSFDPNNEEPNVCTARTYVDM